MKNVICEKVGDWEATLNREAYELDPQTVKLNSHRYHLNEIVGTHYILWDSLEKKTIEIKGEGRWEKWSNAHRKEYCTNF